MANRTTRRIGFGALGVFAIALTVACGGAPGNEGEDMPTDDSTPTVTEQPTPTPTQPSHLPPLGGDPGKVTHGPVTPSEED